MIGTEMALATAKLVTTHVPWLTEVPRLPEMVGMATLAMDESSTIMKVAIASDTVISQRCAPVSGGCDVIASALPAGIGGNQVRHPGADIVKLGRVHPRCHHRLRARHGRQHRTTGVRGIHRADHR